MDASGILLRRLMSIYAGRFPFDDLPPVLPLLPRPSLTPEPRMDFPLRHDCAETGNLRPHLSSGSVVRRRESIYRVSSSKSSVSARDNKYSLCSRTGGGTMNLIGYGCDKAHEGLMPQWPR